MSYERIRKELMDKNPKKTEDYPSGTAFYFDEPIMVTSEKVNDGEVFTEIGLRKDGMMLVGNYCYARMIPASEYKNVKVL